MSCSRRGANVVVRPILDIRSAGFPSPRLLEPVDVTAPGPAGRKRAFDACGRLHPGLCCYGRMSSSACGCRVLLLKSLSEGKGNAVVDQIGRSPFLLRCGFMPA